MNAAVDARTLSQRYDEGYFHGQSSGYPAEGYEHAHASWRHHLLTAKAALGENLQWLDVGCAYGFLIEEAERLGIQAIGADISSYALRQHSSARGRLTQAEACRLPIQDGSLDVVSAFDLLEHLEDPESAIREWKRILRPKGLLFLSTPDPCTFDQEEPTHLSERPPSYWAAILRRNGLEPVLRFGGEFYECEICACQAEASGEFDLSAYATGHAKDIFPSQLNGDIFVVPRGGWGTIETDENGSFRWIGKTSAVYLLNAGDEPVRCRLSIRMRGENHPDATIGSQRLRHLSRDEKTTIHEWEPFDLPVGGSVLTLSVGEGHAIPAERIEIEILPLERAQYLEELPFDLYQRYRLLSEVVGILKEKSEEASVLEVGGGGSPLSYFLTESHITVSDLVWEDRPWFLKCDAQRLPYPDCSFDFIVGCDFLEHVPEDRRSPILSELKRVARSGVILIGPTDRREILDADALLRRFLIARFGRDNRFLEEHERYGLPNADHIADSLSTDDWHTLALPSGLLERWLPMQLCSAYLESVAELAPLRQEINRLYNRTYYRRDNDSPAYRTLILALCQKLNAAKKASLVGLLAEPSETEIAWDFASFLLELFNVDFLRERSQEVGQRDKHIQDLLGHASALEESRERISKHAENLTELLEREQDERRKVIQHASDLRDHITRLEEHIDDLEEDAEGRRVQWKEVQRHADNLTAMLTERDERVSELERHAADVSARLQSSQSERERLNNLLADQSKATEALSGQVLSLDGRLEQILQHANNLDSLLAQREERIGSLLEHCGNQEKLIAQGEERAASLLDHAHNLERLIGEKDTELTQLRETVHRLEDELREIQAGLAYRILAKVSGKKQPDSDKPPDSSDPSQ
ncbi:MAG: methyltransferase domain-containing protein [bacterium]